MTIFKNYEIALIFLYSPLTYIIILYKGKICKVMKTKLFYIVIIKQLFHNILLIFNKRQSRNNFHFYFVVKILSVHHHFSLSRKQDLITTATRCLWQCGNQLHNLCNPRNPHCVLYNFCSIAVSLKP